MKQDKWIFGIAVLVYIENEISIYVTLAFCGSSYIIDFNKYGKYYFTGVYGGPDFRKENSQYQINVYHYKGLYIVVTPLGTQISNSTNFYEDSSLIKPKTYSMVYMKNRVIFRNDYNNEICDFNLTQKIKKRKGLKFAKDLAKAILNECSVTEIVAFFQPLLN